jgi:glycine cleavage system aminomethyltransferase T
MTWLLKKTPPYVGQDGAHVDRHRLVTIKFDDPEALMYSWAPVYLRDEVVGWVASGDFGYSVGAFLAHAYVPRELAAAGTRLRVRYTGRFFEGEIVPGPVWDPENQRLKA